MDKFNKIRANVGKDLNKWNIELGEIGNPYLCILSFFLTPIAVAYTKYYFDNTPICFSLFFGNHVNNRRDVRLAYNIKGNDFDDICTSILCCCCSINQVDTQIILGLLY